MNSIILQKLISMFVSKKKIIGWISAIVIGAVALFAGMSSQEVKDAICSQEVPQVPAAVDKAVDNVEERK